MNKYTYSLILLVLFYGCNKYDLDSEYEEGCIIIEGNIVSERNRIPAEGIKAVLYSEPIEFIGLTITIGTTYSDENGKFKFIYKPKEKRMHGKYTLSLKHSDYINEEFKYFSCDTGVVTSKRFFMAKKAKLKIIVEGYYPVLEEDKLLIWSVWYPDATSSINQDYAIGIAEIIENEDMLSVGEPIQANCEITYETSGNSYAYIRTTKVKNGIQTNTTDTVYVSLNETYIHKLNY